MLLSTGRGSLGYLKGNSPMDKDYWSSLHMHQEFWINVNSIFKETEKVPFKDRTMFVWYLIVFSCPTDDLGWIPRRDLIGSKSLIRDGKGRMSRALRQLQCFVRLGMILLIWQSSQCLGWREPDAGCSAEIKMYTKWMSWSSLEAQLSYLYVQTI